ncbi:MAG: flagellar hook-associated protein 3 [Spirochaetia bacterium]
MRRISSGMTMTDMQNALRRREYEMNRLQNRMATQSRIQNLRDDPAAAAHATRFQSNITHLNRYENNVETVRSNYQVAEGYARQAGDILQRVRELAVQGATGTYSEDELQYMGEEVNELLAELVNIANARGGDGNMIFGGSDVNQEPFRAYSSHVPGAGRDLITSVEYTGNIVENQVEISEGNYIENNFPGNQVFWAEQHQVYSSVDASNYQVQQDSTIQIDNTEVQLREGDNIHAVISRINDAGAAVRASLDPVRNSLVLSSTQPHQMWIRDGAESTVLEDLGVLSGNGNTPPENLAEEATEFGGSVFDMVIHLRDSLFEGDSEAVGTSGIRGIDSAHERLLTSMADIGARAERLDIAQTRLSSEIPEMQDRLSTLTDLDITQAITELRMMEYTHQAALGTAGRIMQQTLLDFLR